MNELSLGTLGFLGLETLGGTLAVILGFGALVFVHELGHFLAAKWAGVRVEVFSLGFGPRVLGFERGGTDYRISALPLGGYVKMLGQDDSDPTVARTAEPDDFRNKSVGARMVILSAGVIMNLFFAVTAFIVSSAIGIEFTAPEIGSIQANGAASAARLVGDASARSSTPSASGNGSSQGLQPGDYVLAINGSEILAWEDIQTTVALAGERVVLDVARPNSATGVVERLSFEAHPKREEDDPFPRIGVEPLSVIASFTDDSPCRGKGLEKDDQIVGFAPVGAPVAPRADAVHELDAYQQANPGQPLQLLVERRLYDDDGRPRPERPKRVAVEVTPLGRPLYDLGLAFKDEARVRSLQGDAPARGILEVGDTLLTIDGQAVSSTNLRDVVKAAGDAHRRSGGSGPGALAPGASTPGDAATSPTKRPVETSDPVVVTYARPGHPGTLEGKVALRRTPNDDGWMLGIAFVADTVSAVVPGSPAATAGIEPGDHVTTVWTETFLGLKYRHPERVQGGAHLIALASARQDKPMKLGWEKPDGKERTAVLVARDSGRKLGDLGIQLGARQIVVRRGAVGACALGVRRTVRTIQQLVLTIRQLFARNVSTRELGGPIQIATITYKIAQLGLGKLIYFLAILSINLAVLNILPIPVLDGGHLFLLTIEKLKGRPLSDDVLRYVQYGGLVFVLGLMAYVTFNDIRRWFE